MIEDIIWLDSIVDKLAWKHNVMTSEVEDVLTSRCRIFKKEKGKVEGEHVQRSGANEARTLFVDIFHPEIE